MRTVLTLFVLLCGNKLWAEPVRIVDTGPGPADGSTGLLLDSTSWLAAGFTTDQPYNIQSIEAWMRVFRVGVLTIRLYSGDELSDTPLFENGVFLPLDVVPVADWKGVHGLNWTIEPGRYWAAFEVSRVSTFQAALPFPSAGGIPFAFRDLTLPGSDYVHFPVGRVSPWGVRVDAEPLSPTPEPSTMLLVGTGALALARRRLNV
jgi:hypothetical protein